MPDRIHVLALDSAGKGHWRTVEPAIAATTVHEVLVPTESWARSHAPHSAPWRTLRDRIDQDIAMLGAQLKPGDSLAVFARDVPAAAAVLMGNRIARRLPSAQVQYFDHVRTRRSAGWRPCGPFPADIDESSSRVLAARFDDIDGQTRDVAVIVQVEGRIDRNAVDGALTGSRPTSTGRLTLTLTHARPRRGAVVEPGDIERALADSAHAVEMLFKRAPQVQRLHVFFNGPPALSMRFADELLGLGASMTVYVEQTDGFAPAVLLAPRTDARLVPEPIRPEGKDGHDIFIAFANADRELANNLYERFTDRGLTVFLDERSLLPGDVWTQAIPAALAGARSVVALLSPRPKSEPGPSTGWYQDEELIQSLRHARRSANALGLFPVLLDGLEAHEMPYGLQGLNAIHVPDTLGSPGADDTAAAKLDAIAAYIDAQLATVLPKPSEPKATT